MTHALIFQDTFLVSGIMCHQGCGASIERALLACLQSCKKKGLLPNDAQLVMDAEPQAFGIHRLWITIESEATTPHPLEPLAALFRKSTHDVGFEVVGNPNSAEQKSSLYVNWKNIIINLSAIAVIMALSLLFPPSHILTIGLTAITLITITFTTRHYLVHFFHNLRTNNITNMTTTITLGWFLSLAHTLYHAISMPLAHSLSMTFMSFIMPVLLITIINGMDEIKRQMLSRTKKMHLQGMKTLFPQMAETYPCYRVSPIDAASIAQYLATLSDTADEHALRHCESNDERFIPPEQLPAYLHTLLQQNQPIMERKSALKEGMMIHIQPGECFPVDGILIQGHTLVDASFLTGEPQQDKPCFSHVPAGAINIGQPVTLYATHSAYNSSLNQLLFRANRAKEKRPPITNRTFTYLYTVLIGTGIVASIIAPWALGIFTFPLLLQNVTGILFAVCPCTIAIAHQLPHLLSLYQRSNQGILLRNEQLTQSSEDIHTLVFDKTGTLTTGQSQVESFAGLSPAVWERIYLLEKHHGAHHPLANAICHFYEAHRAHDSILNDVAQVKTCPNNRGLSAMVQGKHLHIGNADYLRQADITLPDLPKHKLARGYSPVYIAENGVYQGVIFIQHEIRPGVLTALLRLKKEGKKIIMLTGDSRLSAIGFNQQYGAIFDECDIHAEQTPPQKEAFLKALMDKQNIRPQGVWFVGDGLNDASCSRMVSEKGGVSCAITSHEKAAFFTDISLNGTLDYVFEHHQINRFLKRNILQNQGILIYGALAFLAFIMTFSFAGIAVSPLIPLMVMVCTTLFVVLNAYRVQLAVEQALDKKTSKLKRFLRSDGSIGLWVGASALLMGHFFISTMATGGLALPSIVFSAGLTAAISSMCVITAVALLGVFGVSVATYWCLDRRSNRNNPLPQAAATKPQLCEESHSHAHGAPEPPASVPPLSERQRAPSQFETMSRPDLGTHEYSPQNL